MRIVFMGTPGFAVPTLEAIHQQGHKVAAVFTQPDRPSGRGRSIAFPQVKQKAIELGISIQQPDTLKQNQTHSEANEESHSLRQTPRLARCIAQCNAQGRLIQTIINLEPEVLVVVAYGLKLPNDILNIPKYGAVNLHPSLLPKYRGAAPINHALINGEKTTGITSILMNSRMDAGDIILQEEVLIANDENAGELEIRLANLGADLIIRSLDVLKAGGSEFKKQDESLVTFAPKLSAEDGHIQWDRPSKEITNRVRGLTPRPGAFAMFKGKRLEILNILTNYESQIKNYEYLPGQVVAVDKDKGPVIKTIDGAVILTEVKPQGKKAMGGDEFLRGYKPAVGEKLL